MYKIFMRHTSNVQVSAVRAQLGVPGKELLERDMVGRCELNAAAVGRRDNNSLLASLNGDRDDGHGLGGNGSKGKDGDRDLHG